MSKKFIDIEKAIDSKNPALLKWMPGFMLNYIKRVTHEAWMNDVLDRVDHLHGIDYAKGLMRELNIEVELKGKENIPKTGGIIIAANHPLGGIDGIALIQAIGEVRADVRFLVNDLLMAFKNFNTLFVPINKHGKNSGDTLAAIESAYSESYAVLIFPAGLVSRKDESGIRDLQWKKSFVSKAKKYKKDILPCFIGGKNSKFFYNLAYWRKKIGIKANIEMFYLADELYKQQGQKVVITVGEQISYQSLNSSKTDGQWADHLKDVVYELGKKE
ncbi:1-acyl-sn-glycerol-3-phosphate acyltransferase [Algoriphagus aquimarinus]|uniref:Putative hemolysin n=1 Tax=Algoriphagus aquimarinus TaxID=237018 RepID=A0A1I1AY34_9BACT|nr:1-acyl-sn-glycerol-3-phosphate acyltransferase [Algoriphagus aquimarinus]SFB41280.1 Putative hemolysin [Algoriphagus aquimarinus]|tara:strand:+ start:82730 stop:83548 length:819 start_codon:yes stop_codon:yes gene_type:complete